MDTNKMYERLSAMQKSIRRGLQDEAGFWFFALAEDGNFGTAIQRLKITAHEDVGTGDMQSVAFALRCIDDAADLYKTKRGWRVAVANAILALCNSRKTRIADHFQAVCRGRYLNNPEQLVPDWALDKHTIRGKRMRRGFDHFRTEGAKLVPENHDNYEEEAYKYWKSGVLDQKLAEENQNGKLF